MTAYWNSPMCDVGQRNADHAEELCDDCLRIALAAALEAQ